MLYERGGYRFALRVRYRWRFADLPQGSVHYQATFLIYACSLRIGDSNSYLLRCCIGMHYEIILQSPAVAVYNPVYAGIYIFIHDTAISIPPGYPLRAM